MRDVYKQAWRPGVRGAGAVVTAMDLWDVCFFVLTFRLGLGKDISNVTYEIRKIDSCPVEGYFFRRDLAPNQVSPGPCWLCFCRDNGTATCWQRDQKRCDVEKYHHHRVGRNLRYRRSFSDIFLRDGTREFFNKNLPQQCKPNESFSSGCPPEDWCLGCTVCDCDSTNRWDCHILSFCDGKERKRKVKAGSNKPGRIKPSNVSHKKVRPTKKPTRKPYIKPTTKSPAKNVKKVVRAKNAKNISNLPNRKNKISDKTKQHKIQARPTKKPNQKINSSKKAQNKAIQIKRGPQNRHQTNKISQNQKSQINNASKVKVIRRAVATRKPIQLLNNAIKGLKINPNNNDTVKIGQKIIKQVMTAFQKIMRREMDKLEMERKQRIVDGLDCGKVNKRDKRTYNERSKAAGRNKNKYSRPALIKENYTNARSKREILSNDKTKLDTVSVITLPTDGNDVIPLEKNAKHYNFSTNPLYNFKIISNLTSTQKDYYKYTVKNNTSQYNTSIPHTTESMKNVVDKNESDIFSNFIMSSDYSHNISNIINEIIHEGNITLNKTIYSRQNNAKNKTEGMNPDFNDLKFDKWQIIKLKKEERKIPVTRLVLSRLGTTKSFQDTVKLDKTFKTTEVPRIKITTKSYLANKMNYNTTTSYVQRNAYNSTYKTDVTGLKNILESLFLEMNSTKHEPHTKRRKFKSKVSILKYVRRFFHNLFSKSKSKNHKVYGLGPQEDHTLQILCENVGPCKIKRNNKLLLKFKLNQLNRETKTVLRSVRTVKGLLHLLELPGDNYDNNFSFQSDIQKLGAVLRDYKNDDVNANLTFTQKTQIDYIKKNTQAFIESVKKFADTLTDIIAMITPTPESEYPVDFLKYAPTTPPSINQINKGELKLNKIKNILYNYNLMQNKFMKKMYELINGDEKLITTTKNPRKLASYRSNNKDTDNVIEKYSKNIIHSLRKLKNVVHILSTRRKKRELSMRDDALDYLLMMMEFLIKNKKPLDQRSTDHDGIDLLIDAIKSAPEIPPIKKYVLDNEHSSLHSSTISSKSESSDSMDNSDSKRISNEESQTDLYENNFNQDNEMRDAISNKSKLEETPVSTAEDEVTQKVYFRVFNDLLNDNTETYETNISVKNTSNEEKVGFDKFESVIVDPKKFDHYNEEDSPGFSTTGFERNIIKSSSNNLTFQYLDEQKTTRREEADIPVPLFKQSESTSQSREYLHNNKTKLDWIEETFDREIKEFSRARNNSSHRSSTVPTSSTTVRITEDLRRHKKVPNDMRENLGGNGKRIAKKTSQMDSDDVMTVKQLRFLNSLDYGTDKSVDFEEAESKDETRSDGDESAYFL